LVVSKRPQRTKSTKMELARSAGQGSPHQEHSSPDFLDFYNWHVNGCSVLRLLNTIMSILCVYSQDCPNRPNVWGDHVEWPSNHKVGDIEDTDHSFGQGVCKQTSVSPLGLHVSCICHHHNALLYPSAYYVR
jgi:hypothetical protein